MFMSIVYLGIEMCWFDCCRMMSFIAFTSEFHHFFSVQSFVLHYDLGVREQLP